MLLILSYRMKIILFAKTTTTYVCVRVFQVSTTYSMDCMVLCLEIVDYISYYHKLILALKYPLEIDKLIHSYLQAPQEVVQAS